MEELDHTSSVLALSSLASSLSSTNRESSGAASTSSSPSQVREEEEEEEEDYDRPPQTVQQQTGVSYHVHFPTTDDEASRLIRDDTWSCIIVVLTFWFFVSLTFILGVYGSVNLRFGPNCSLLVQPNSFFVEYIKVEELDGAKTAPTLYGLYKTPPLDVTTTWSEIHNASLPGSSHKEWIYILNKGSQINISYSVNSPSSSSLVLLIAQGSESFAQWLEDPSYPNTTLSWNIICGSGMIQQDILKSSSYYVAVGNLNSEEVEVQLNIRVKAFLYNATAAYYKCSLAQGSCISKVFFPHGNAVVLTSPGPEQGAASNEWYVKLSYGPVHP
uniref:E3 ubiquitin-protein ligase APD1-4 N-terminal domain-containing protein n=1 Tax=Davidia involucrata TaxID=16924 RepID=A0A5B6ZBZ8_DAVIN